MNRNGPAAPQTKRSPTSQINLEFQAFQLDPAAAYGFEPPLAYRGDREASFFSDLSSMPEYQDPTFDAHDDQDTTDGDELRPNMDVDGDDVGPSFEGQAPKRSGSKGGRAHHGQNAFPNKLWQLVNDPATDAFISWAHDGKSFHVMNSEGFKGELPKNWKHSNFSSLVRQLNMYDFHKTNRAPRRGVAGGDQLCQYSHGKDLFMRGHPELLPLIKRKVAPDAIPREGINHPPVDTAPSNERIETKHVSAHSHVGHAQHCPAQQEVVRLQTQMNGLLTVMQSLISAVQSHSIVDLRGLQEHVQHLASHTVPLPDNPPPFGIPERHTNATPRPTFSNDSTVTSNRNLNPLVTSNPQVSNALSPYPDQYPTVASSPNYANGDQASGTMYMQPPTQQTQSSYSSHFPLSQPNSQPLSREPSGSFSSGTSSPPTLHPSDSYSNPSSQVMSSASSPRGQSSSGSNVLNSGVRRAPAYGQTAVGGRSYALAAVPPAQGPPSASSSSSSGIFGSVTSVFNRPTSP